MSERSLICERGLRLVRPVAGIVSGFDLRETPDARSVDLGDGVLDLLALDGFFDRAILDLSLQVDELALQERLGEGGEIAPGIDAVPFGAGFILALVGPLVRSYSLNWRLWSRRAPGRLGRGRNAGWVAVERLPGIERREDLTGLVTAGTSTDRFENQ